MKRTVILAAFLILLATSVNGLYNPNSTYNNTNGDGDMAITTHSGSSASTAVRAADGNNSSQTMWTADITMKNRSQDQKISGTIEDISFHNTADDKQQARFTGYIQTPTPCHTVDHKVTETDDGYVFTVTTEKPDDTQMCAQVVTTVAYDAAFETDAPYTLTVKHGDKTIDTMQTPGTDEPDDTNRLGILSGFFTLLSSLF